MIKSVRLINWKSYKDSLVYLDPLTILIGLNASGKSNLMDALLFLQRSIHLPLKEAISGNAQLEEIRGGADMVVWKGESKFGFEVVFQEDEKKELVYWLEAEVVDQSQAPKLHLCSEKLQRRTKAGIKSDRISTSQLFWTDEAAEGKEYITVRVKNKRGTPHQLNRQATALHYFGTTEVAEEVKSAIELIRHSLKNIFLLDPVPSRARAFSRLSDSLLPDGSNVAGVIAALPESEQIRVMHALKEYVGQLPDNPFEKISSELVGKFQQDAMLYGQERLPNQRLVEVDARSMSDGTLRMIIILTAILTRPPQSLMIIEEVDNGIYPSKAKLLLGFLDRLSQEREIDILVTTHNIALMDAISEQGDLLPFISVVYRRAEDGASAIVPFTELNNLPWLLGFGPLGKLAEKGLIGQSHFQGA